MASAIVDGTNIDLSVFSYSAPKANPAGGKVVNLYNKNFKESLTIAVPLMGSWGAQESKETVGKDATGKPITKGTGKYTMSLQFATGQYTTPDADKFLEQLKAVENKIKQDAMTYSKDWFGKQINSMDVIEEKVSPMLKYSKIKGTEEHDYSRPPSLSVKLPCWKGIWQSSVFDEDGNPLYIKGKTEDGITPLDFLTSHSKAPIQVICLIQCGGLWFVNGKIAITWNLLQCVVKKPKTSSISNDTCFLSVKPADREVLKSQPEHELIQNDNTVSALVEDSDDEEEYTLPPPVQVVNVVENVAPPAPVVETTTQVVTEEPVKKKAVARKVKAKE
jgi:hypothetical protein